MPYTQCRVYTVQCTPYSVYTEHDVRANSDAKNIQNCPQAKRFSYSKYTKTLASTGRPLQLNTQRTQALFLSVRIASNGRKSHAYAEKKMTATSWTENRSSHVCFSQLVSALTSDQATTNILNNLLLLLILSIVHAHCTYTLCRWFVSFHLFNFFFQKWFYFPFIFEEITCSV